MTVYASVTVLDTENNNKPVAIFWELWPGYIHEKVSEFRRDSKKFVLRFEDIDTEDERWSTNPTS